MLLGQCGQPIDHRGQPAGEHLQAVAHQHQVGVVGDVATGGAEMDDAFGCWALIAVGVDVGHHVVPQAPFVGFGGGEIDFVDVLLEFRDLLGLDRQAQFGFGFGQPDPELAPGAEFFVVAPEAAHLLGRRSGGLGGFRKTRGTCKGPGARIERRETEANRQTLNSSPRNALSPMARKCREAILPLRGVAFRQRLLPGWTRR